MKSAICLLIAGAFATPLFAQPSAPTLLSAPGAPTISGSGHSYSPVLSEDGRIVVFLSTARNLVTNDNLAPYLDVFLHDLVTGETRLITRGANADSSAASVSSDGAQIAFVSAASNLLPQADNNFGADIFLADANAFARSLITGTPAGDSPANAVRTRNVPLSDKPRVSAHARRIAFESFATNLTAETDANNESDVFVRDMSNNQTVLVSAALEGGSTANGKSEVVGITPNANYILFASTATNLTADNLTNRNQELYLRDVAAGTTTWVVHSNTIPPDIALPAPPPPPGNVGPYSCRWASMSGNADFVLYKVEFPSKTNARVHLYDRQMNSNIVVTTRARPGSPIHMSSDARFIAYDETNHVFLWDRQTGTRTQVSTNTDSYSPVVSEDGSIVTFVNGVPRMPAQIFYRTMASGEVLPLTETLSGGPSSKDHYNSSVAIDPAGQFIVFESAEDDLVGNDRNRASDIFVHDIASGQTRLISRAHQSSVAFTAAGRSGITNSCLSADGNRLLFFSHDSNLVPGDTNGWPDAFVRQIDTGTTTPLTKNELGLFGGTNSVAHGLLSANGRYALLGLLAPGSLCEFANAPVAVVRKDLDTGETITIVSNITSGYAFPPAVRSFGFSMSANGQLVAYPWGNLIVVADLQTGVQTNVTGNDAWADPMISPDGRYVIYLHTTSGQLFISDLSTGQRSTINSSLLRGGAFSQNSQIVVYGTPREQVPGINLYSISAGTNALVCANCRNPSISADGRFVVYEKAVSTPRQVELKDMLMGKTWAVTRAVNGVGGANTDAAAPIVSADGRFVAYTSKATNLTTDAPNGWNNLYIYDRLQGSTLRVTGSAGNTGYGSGSASRPVLGPDGRTLVFQSFASDFVANDFNDTRDIFLVRLGEGDSDNDGMSDSWEQTYFSTINRDGTGDFDNDGQTDLAEYLAGTNPNDGQSVFEVLQITSINTGQRQLIWSAQPGKSYRLEYKSELADATWTSLGQVITATAPTASAIDTTATSEKRFYRVALVQ